MKIQLGASAPMIELTDKDLLGVGGEASVYRAQGLAIKIYHPIDANASAQEQDQARKLLSLKLDKLRSFPRGLPAQVLAPLELALDARGQTVGFSMPSVEGAENMLRLGQRKWREGVVSNEAVTELFRKVHATLGGIHAKNVVVGDLNDSNLMFQGDRVWFIDVDSMQFGGYPCVVGHERFLDPRLYGANLTDGCRFQPENDWYSFAVMLFSSLLYVHPYGGVHPKYPTLLRRAEARHSLLRPDVTPPKAAIPYRVLPDEMLGWFERIFDQDAREAFPRRLLDLRWTRCGCGLEHCRSACPDCATKAPAREATRFHGKCRQALVFSTRGRILAAAMQGGLKYLYEEGGVVRREDGARVLEQGLAPGLRFGLAGGSTWIGMGRSAVRVEHERPMQRLSTEAFSANSTGLYRLQDEWLVDAQGLRVGRILEGQTWLRVGERLGFGFYRAGRLSVYFLFRVGRPGLQRVELPPLEGRLLEAAAVFDERHVLFLATTEKNGQRLGRMHLIREDGQVLASREEAPESSRVLGTLQGKALLDGRLLCATDQGLLSLKAENGRIEEGTLFTDTEPFLQAGADLLPASDGSVYVITTKEITKLTLL